MEWLLRDPLPLLTFLAILVALFGADFVRWLKRPNLKLFFDIGEESCFHIFRTSPGEHNVANCLFKITNEPRKWRLFKFLQTETARGVEAKVTYIDYGQNRYAYHPTRLNWSGGNFRESESIIAGSHHYLDFVKFSPVNFRPWLAPGFDGIIYEFYGDGEYRIYLVINGENCGPYKYVATINYSNSEWHSPLIRIDQDNS